MWRTDQGFSPIRQPVFEPLSPNAKERPSQAPEQPPVKPPQPSPSGSSYGVPPDPAEQQRRQRASAATPPSASRPAGSRSVSFRVPDDDSGSEGDTGDDDDVTSHMPARSAAVTSSSGRRRPADPVHAVHLARTRQLKQQAHASFVTSTQALHQELLQIEAELSAELARVASEAGDRRASWGRQQEEQIAKLVAARQRREEQLNLAGDSAEQRKLLEEARRQREAQQRAEAQARAAAEARRREEEERRRREEEEAKRKAQAEATARAAEEATRAAEAVAKQQQEQRHKSQQQQQPAAAAAATPGTASALAGTADAAAAGPGGDLKAAPGALEWERAMAEKLAAAEEQVKDLMTKLELKPQRRMVEKKVTLIVSQIAGTQQQVSDKVDDVLRLLSSCPDEATRTLTCLTLATRMVSQCDSQVANCPSFAFPLALVCVRVGAQVPLVIDLLVAKLHQACILTVPKYYTYRPGGPTSEADHFARLGYQMVDDAKRPGHKRLETTDEYALRVSAYLYLYAALLGTPGGDARAPHPHPAANGWAWMARHLNALPATRVTAAALHAFVAHAGFALNAMFRRQFIKVLRLVYDEWLPDLGSHDDDAAAVATRLRTYLDDRLFDRPPEGLAIKKTDVSSWWGQRDEPPGGGGGGRGRW